MNDRKGQHVFDMEYSSRPDVPSVVLKDADDPEFREMILGHLILLSPTVSYGLDLSKDLLETNREIFAMVEQELEAM